MDDNIFQLDIADDGEQSENEAAEDEYVGAPLENELHNELAASSAEETHEEVLTAFEYSEPPITSPEVDQKASEISIEKEQKNVGEEGTDFQISDIDLVTDENEEGTEILKLEGSIHEKGDQEIQEEETFQKDLKTEFKESSAEMKYFIPSRMGDINIEEDQGISGDFQPLEKDQDRSDIKICFKDDYEVFSDSSEEILTVTKPEELPKKELLTAKAGLRGKVKALEATLTTAKIRNSILHKFVIKYMKKHNRENAFRGEEDVTFDDVMKYNNKLLGLHDRLMRIEYSQKTIINDLENIEQKKNIVKQRLEESLAEFQLREETIAKGCRFVKGGQEITEKVISRFLSRQKNSFANHCQMRMEHQLLRSTVEHKSAEIEQLDVVGEGFYLFNFEILKNENRLHLDKIEEKNEELSNYRLRYRKIAQVLAHIREKVSAMEEDKAYMFLEATRLSSEVDDFRRQLNTIKQERDNSRQQLEKLKIESALVAENALLRDMEESIKEHQILKEELKRCQEEYAIQNKYLRNLRKARERLEATRKVHKPKNPPHKKKVMKIRPSILYPAQVATSSFSHLKDLAPRVQRLNPF